MRRDVRVLTMKKCMDCGTTVGMLYAMDIPIWYCKECEGTVCHDCAAVLDEDEEGDEFAVCKSCASMSQKDPR